MTVAVERRCDDIHNGNVVDHVCNAQGLLPPFLNTSSDQELKAGNEAMCFVTEFLA